MSESNDFPATHGQVVHAFLAIPPNHLAAHNWGTSPWELRHEWQVNDETYINGVILTVDLDYVMGYVIEAVDRTTSVVSYYAIVTFYGPREDGTIEHDSMMYGQNPDGSEGVVGTFFDREVDSQDAAYWGLPRIYGMIEGHQDAQRA